MNIPFIVVMEASCVIPCAYENDELHPATSSIRMRSTPAVTGHHCITQLTFHAS